MKGSTCSMRNMLRILAEKPLGKESFTELRRWDDNIRTDFSEQDMMM